MRYSLWPQVNIKVGEDGVQNAEETRQNFKHFPVNVKWKERSHQIGKASCFAQVCWFWFSPSVRPTVNL